MDQLLIKNAAAVLKVPSKRPRKVSRFDALPSELYAHIFRYCGLDTRCKIRRTCRFWKHMAADDPDVREIVLLDKTSIPSDWPNHSPAEARKRLDSWHRSAGRILGGHVRTIIYNGQNRHHALWCGKVPSGYRYGTNYRNRQSFPEGVLEPVAMLCPNVDVLVAYGIKGHVGLSATFQLSKFFRKNAFKSIGFQRLSAVVAKVSDLDMTSHWHSTAYGTHDESKEVCVTLPTLVKSFSNKKDRRRG